MRGGFAVVCAACAAAGAVSGGGVKRIDAGGGAACPTLAAALAETAAFRKTDTRTPVEIVLAEGEHPVAWTVEIGPAHARAGWGKLTVRGASDAPWDAARRPRLVGGERVTGWTKRGFRGRDDVWTADVKALKLSARHKLFYFNGARMEAARWPNVDSCDPYRTGWAAAAAPGASQNMWDGKRFSKTGFFEDELHLAEGDRRGWADPTEGWVVVFPRHNWWNRVFNITNAAADRLVLGTAHKEMDDRLFIWDRWCIQGVAEELDAPGEWYYETAAGLIHFIPPAGVADPNAGTARAAGGRGPLLRVRDCANVEIAGLDLSCGDAGVEVRNADDVRVAACAVHDVGFHGGSAVTVRGHRVRVEDSDVWNTGGNGIYVDGFPKENRVADRLDVAVLNNYVHHCGLVNSHGIGIWLNGQGVRVSHNLIHDMPRCGIFGFGRFCEISYNRIRHVNVINDDTGAIYGGGWTSGTGTKVCFNRISDSIGFQRGRDGRYVRYHGACGIYPDEGCGALEVYGNLVERCHHVAMHLHNGRWITISNNVFVSNGALPLNVNTAQLSMQTWNNDTNGYFVAVRQKDIAKQYHRLVDADPDWLKFPDLAQAPDVPEKVFLEDGTTMTGVQVRNNIFAYADQGTGVVLRAYWLNAKANPFDNNVYWPGAGNEVRFGVKDLSRLDVRRAAGQDVRSVVADPKFRDPANGDYRLSADSPAFKTGFVELPYDRMGLQVTPLRPALPREAPGMREHPEW